MNSPHSHQILNVLIHQAGVESFDPGKIIHLVGQILGDIGTLDMEEKKVFRQYVGEIYLDIRKFAQNSSEISIKKIAGKCAFLLDNQDDLLDFYYEAYKRGDLESLLSLLTYLESIGQEERIAGLLNYGWNEWKERIEISFGEREIAFLHMLISVAYRSHCDDIAQEIILLLHGSPLYSSDSDILRYRKVIRNPREYVVALNEIFILYFTGKSERVSLELLKNTQEYIESQIQFLHETNEIESSMFYFLENLDSGEKSEDDYQFATAEGKTYFAFKHYILLSILYADIARSEYILSIMESNPDIIDLLSDIIVELGMIENDGGGDSYSMTSYEIVFEGFLVHLLKVFGGIEYSDLHERIYRNMLLLNSTLSVQSFIDAHRTSTCMKEFRLGTSGLENFYHPLVTEMERTSHPLVRLHILDQVGKNEGIESPADTITIAYYAMEYCLLYGAFPRIHESVFEQIKNNSWYMSPFVESFFKVFYSVDWMGDSQKDS